MNAQRRADEALVTAYAYSRAHSKLAVWAERRYGAFGPLISGIVREHFPEPVKGTLRVLARNVGTRLECSLSLWRIAGKRRSTWIRAKEQTIAQHGRGFYG
jgi:hypothetical protein